MKLFKSWILRKAEEIKAKEEEAAANQRKLQEELWESDRLLVRSLKDTIYVELDKIAEAKLSEPCHIAVGDRVIINYFSIGREGRNGWDGGPTTLLTNIPENERNTPVTAIITDLYVDKSYAHELIDKFFENHRAEWLRKNVNVKVETAWYVYAKWLAARSSQLLGDRFGLYKTAHFDYEGSFKPKWGLNVDSFLKEGTPEFDKTYDLWSREIEIIKKRAELKKDLDALEAEMKKTMKNTATLNT